MENNSLQEHPSVATSSNDSDAILHNQSTLHSLASISEGSLQITVSNNDKEVIERYNNDFPKPQSLVNCKETVLRTSSREEASAEHSDSNQDTNQDNITVQVSVTCEGNHDRERMLVNNQEAKPNSSSETSKINSKVSRVVEPSQIGNVETNTCDNNSVSPTNGASQDSDFDAVGFWSAFDEYKDSPSNVINTQQSQPENRGVNSEEECGAQEANSRTEAGNTNKNSGSDQTDEMMSATVTDNGSGRSPQNNVRAATKPDLLPGSSDQNPEVTRNARSDQTTRSTSATLKDISSEISNVSEGESVTARHLPQTNQPVRPNLPSRKDNSENRPNKIVKESPRKSRSVTRHYSQTVTAKETETLRKRLEKTLRTGTLLSNFATENQSSQSRPAARVSATQVSRKGRTEAPTTSEKQRSEDSDEGPTLPRPPRKPVVLLVNPFYRSPPTTSRREEPEPVNIKQEKTSPPRKVQGPKRVNPFAPKRIEEPSDRVSRKRKNSSTEEESSDERTGGGSRRSRTKTPEESRPRPKRRSLPIGGDSSADEATEAGEERGAGSSIPAVERPEDSRKTPSRTKDSRPRPKRRNLPIGGQSSSDEATEAGEERGAGSSIPAVERPEDSRKTPSRTKDSPGRNSNLFPRNGLISDDSSDQESLESPRLQGAPVEEALQAESRTSCRVTSNIAASGEESRDNVPRGQFALPASWSCFSELMMTSIFSSNASRSVRTSNLSKQVDNTAGEEPLEEVQPEAGTSSTIASSPRRSKPRTRTQEPPVPNEGTSSASCLSPIISKPRTPTKALPAPNEGTSSARVSSLRSSQQRTHTGDPPLPNEGTSSASVSSPRRSEPRTPTKALPAPDEGTSSARGSSLRSSQQRTPTKALPAPNEGTSSAIVSSPRISEPRTPTKALPAPKEGTSSARVSSLRSSQQRTYTEGPPLPNEGTSSAIVSSPRISEPRTPTKALPAPNVGTSSARVFSLRSSQQRTHAGDSPLSNEGTSSASVSSPRRSEPRTPTAACTLATEGTSSARVSSLRSSQQRTHTGDPPLPNEGASSAIVSSPRRSEPRTPTKALPAPNEGTSSARGSSLRSSKQRTHTGDPPLPNEGTSSASVSSPRRSEPRTPTAACTLATRGLLSGRVSLRISKQRTLTEDPSLPNEGTSSARLSSRTRSEKRIHTEESPVPIPNATHLIAGPLGNVEMFPFEFGNRSGPISIQATLVDIYPSLSDLTVSRSLNLLSGFCRLGCHRTTRFSKLVWVPVNGNDSRRNALCRHCSKNGLSKSVELDFRFVANVEIPSGECIEVIFTSDFAANFLQCSKEEFSISETRRADVLRRLTTLIDNKIPIKSNLVVVETKSGHHFRAI